MSDEWRDSILAHIPRKIAPWATSTQARADFNVRSYDPFVPMYSGDGSLLYVLDRDTHKIVRTARQLPVRPPIVPRSIAEEFDGMALRDPSKVGVVYFLGGDHGGIKIGTTVDLKSRFRAIQACSPIPLRVLASRRGGAWLESAHHGQFREHRLHGEWFSKNPDLISEIVRVRSFRGPEIKLAPIGMLGIRI